jgi:pyrroloquinoline quinone biosynthesis protein B
LAAHGAASLREWFAALRIDIALVDGTFWSASELPPERQGKVPHPPVALSLEMLGPRVAEAGDPQVYFIHLNHTNPVHREDSEEYQRIIELGWGVCTQGHQFVL